MASTSTTANLIVKQQSAKFFAYGRQKMYFSNFIGGVRDDLAFIPKSDKRVRVVSDDNAVIQVQMDLTKKKGDTVTFPMITPLSSNGRVNGTLEDNEEAITNKDWSISIKDWGNAVRDSGALDRQRPAFDWASVNRATLALWYAYALDKATYFAMSGLSFAGAGSTELLAAATPSRRVIGGTEAGGALELFDTDAELQADDLMSVDLIEYISYFADASEPTIRPLIINGEELYCLFMHPYQAKALRASTAWKDVQKYANDRGEKNPLFRKSLGRIANVLLFNYPRVETRLGAGGATAAEYFESGDAFASGVYAARAVLCGAQAVCHAYAQGPTFHEKTFDYGDKHGVALRMLMGVGRPEFNSVDYGCMAIDTAISGYTIS